MSSDYEDLEPGQVYRHAVRRTVTEVDNLLVNAQAVSDLTLGTTLGNLGYEDVRFPNPVRIGDTLRSETTILSKRESAKHPNAGIVIMEHVGYNQRNEVVVRAKRAGLQLKRSGAII